MTHLQPVFDSVIKIQERKRDGDTKSDLLTTKNQGTGGEAVKHGCWGEKRT